MGVKDVDQVLQYLQETGFTDVDGNFMVLELLRPRHLIVADEYIGLVCAALDAIPKRLNIKPKCIASIAILRRPGEEGWPRIRNHGHEEEEVDTQGQCYIRKGPYV